MDAAQIVEACDRLVMRGGKPTLPEVRPLVEAFYELDGNSAGGALHVVLDDGNLERSTIRWCIDNPHRGSADPVARALAQVLLLLSGSQRRRL